MRKFSLLLVVLLAAGSAGLYGQMQISTDFVISGDATATLGYNLDTQKLGFKNEFSSDISITLVPKMSSSNPADMGMDSTGWIGVIELKDFKIIIDDDHDDLNDTSEATSGAGANQENLGSGLGAAGHVHSDADGTDIVIYPHTHELTQSDSTNDDATLTIGPAMEVDGEDYPDGHIIPPHQHDAPEEALPADSSEDAAAKWSISDNDKNPAPAEETRMSAKNSPISGVAGDGIHQHAVTAKNNDPEGHRDIYEIDKVSILRTAAPLPHTHVSHTHDGYGPHTHDPHSHAAQTHDAHTHTGALVVTDPTVTAKLVNGPLSIKIYSAPGNEAGLIDAVEDDDEDDDYAAEGNDKPHDVHVNLGGQGITLGYTTDDFGVAVGITSDVDWDGKDADRNAGQGGWVISGDLMVDIGPAKVDLQIVQGIQTKDGDETVGRNQTGFGAKIGGEIGSLNLSAGVDVVLTGEGDVPPAGAATTRTIRTRTTMADGTPPTDATVMKTTPGAAGTVDDGVEWEFGAGLEFGLSDTTKLEATYIYSTVESVASDIEVILSDDKGIIENLSFAFTWGLYDIANGAAGGPATENDKIDMLVKGDIGYGFDALGGKLTPGVKVTYNQVDDMDPEVVTEVQLVLTEAIPMAELGLKWKSTSLFEPDDNDQGVLTAWTKVKY